ncbi:hypothetical protein SAE02_79030 [Skermanella aerolata]|uniref:Uncharacterized protein n=1 Tax=Skermanella aerolata TaxID=393310 RepID=A0A512E4U4_9PROT|nr:hypothetical protein SAE02_79030 [Skermanella aerolata]
MGLPVQYSPGTYRQGHIVLVSGYINVRPGGWSYLSKPYDLSAIERVVGKPS